MNYKNFRLEVNNIFKSYNTLQTEQLAIIKSSWQKKPTIHRIINADGTRKMQHQRRLIDNIQQQIKSLQSSKLNRQKRECRRMDGQA